MLLAIDIGNTNLTCGLFHGVNLLDTFSMSLHGCSGVENLIAKIERQLSGGSTTATSVNAAVVASVVPLVTPMAMAAIAQATGVTAVDVGPQLLRSMPIACEPKSLVGVDRLVNAVAAHAFESEGQPQRGAIVVDLGTATTLDCVSPRGEFLGGVIAPGIVTGQQGLVAAAAQLNAVSLVAPQSVVGRNTQAAMRSGLILGHACMVDGLVGRLRAELAFELSVIATGGLANAITGQAHSIDRFEPDLTLHGLRVLAERHPG